MNDNKVDGRSKEARAAKQEGLSVKIKITVAIPNSEPVVTYAEVSETGDTANAIRDALDFARKVNPDCSIFDAIIKLESIGDA